MRLPSYIVGSIRAVLMPALLMAGTGCTVIRKQYDTPLPDLSDMQNGASTYADVLAAYGPPAKLSAMNDGALAFLYETADLSERQLGINLTINSITLLKLALAYGEAERQTTAILFDAEGVMQAAIQDQHLERLGSGASVQMILSVASVTDTAGLDSAPATHHWGATLLDANLPRALNTPSSPDSGTAGVEQKGTPSTAGQRALEMRRRNSEK